MAGTREAPLSRVLARGSLVRFAYRLGMQGASGVLSLTPRMDRCSASPFGAAARSGEAVPGGAARAEIFVLRRGGAIVADGELAKRTLSARLTRLASHAQLDAAFEGGVPAQPPGAQHTVPLASWARAHCEAQLDNTLAEHLVRELAGVRLAIRTELAPEPLDEADRRMLLAMARPRRLDQIWPLARTPRFRLLAFLHFLRAVDALDAEGVVADRTGPTRIPGPCDPARAAALRLLGLDAAADVETVKRAYRRIARSLHPDLQPDADADRRRALERRFAEVTAAYDQLL
ncbi:MAG TPA: J domain-containing protein [Kofleriaceae bacterium]|jgi:DnaJ-domain-containing protein 1